MKRTFLVIILSLLLTAGLANAYMLAGILGPGSGGGGSAPSAPTGHSTAAGNAQVTLHPGTASGATAYKYYLRASSDPTTSTYDASGTATDGATVSSLTNGTTYKFGYTASNAYGESPLSTIDTVTPSVPATGSLDFETASLTPVGLSPAYTNNNSTYAARGTSAAHGGSYSMAFTPASGAPYGELVRQIVLPSSGTVSFERWFNPSSMAVPGAPAPCCLFAMSLVTNPTTGPGDWVISVFFEITSGASGVMYYNPGYSSQVLYSKTSMSANTWYRIKVDLNCANNTYNLTLYNASGSQIASATGLSTQTSTFSGATRYSYIGRSSGGANAVYIDDILDGI